MYGTQGGLFALDKGTTTASFITKDGVVVAVDSRATSGSYIASQTVNKVIQVNKYLLGTMAGGAADCFYWERAMGNYAMRHELKYGERIPVGGAAKYLSATLNKYKGKGLSIGSMVCGWGSSGPAIYYVDDSGNCVEGKMFSVGSGSLFAYGILNTGYSYEMEKEDAIELARRAIFHAGHSDAYSGGTVSIYFIDENGWTKVDAQDISCLYDRYM
ncbi:20S proteasome subunit beta 5 [Nematocida minor]|uniref:20S proteasome subunit beta 5 n=1 Tax=Nematocida minor TaxID=1912983 RepID=UPI00221EB061|nr:20S proteasome subunit beta 5 [Nematocida minor]KAI5192642.1 20S proteasome subunit beta 5 [Nematocida minor]